MLSFRIDFRLIYMSSCNLRIKSNYIQVHLPMLTARNNGFKGSPLNKNVSKIIQERKKFYSSLCSSPETSPTKILSLERIRSGLSKLKKLEKIPYASKKPISLVKTLKRNPSFIEVSSKNGSVYLKKHLNLK